MIHEERTKQTTTVKEVWKFRAEKRKKHAQTLHERGAPKVLKMASILILLFSYFLFFIIIPHKKIAADVTLLWFDFLMAS